MAFPSHLAAFFIGAVALPVPWSLAQITVQSSAASLVLPDMLVDRLVADLERAIASQQAADLFGTKIFIDERLDHVPVARGQAAVTTRTFPSCAGLFLRPFETISTVIPTAVALEFSVNRASVPIERERDLGTGEVLLS